MTNGDFIRSMTDEELAELLANEQHRIAKIVFERAGLELEKQVIYAVRLKWLKEEHKVLCEEE